LNEKSTYGPYFYLSFEIGQTVKTQSRTKRREDPKILQFIGAIKNLINFLTLKVKQRSFRVNSTPSGVRTHLSTTCDLDVELRKLKAEAGFE